MSDLTILACISSVTILAIWRIATVYNRKGWFLRRQNLKLKAELLRAKSYHESLMRATWTRAGQIKR